MSGRLIIQGKAWGEFESAKRSKGNIEISGYRSYGGTHTVRMVEQPQLNEYQQIAINNAKKSFEKGSDLYDCAIDMMLYDGLTDKEWAKATVVFLLWAQEQEEE
ncbi:hypothetical protein [Enterococcus gallinarum]|uniref:hypothetical protein n=1 Tax=Enterococcus gallinarum TaxID=1353 RepID=UPI0035CAC7A8